VPSNILRGFQYQFDRSYEKTKSSDASFPLCIAIKSVGGTSKELSGYLVYCVDCDYIFRPLVTWWWPSKEAETCNHHPRNKVDNRTVVFWCTYHPSEKMKIRTTTLTKQAPVLNHANSIRPSKPLNNFPLLNTVTYIMSILYYSWTWKCRPFQWNDYSSKRSVNQECIIGHQALKKLHEISLHGDVIWLD
jgi:hypothetical protein